MEAIYYDATARALLDENRLPVARDVNENDAAVIVAALRGPHAGLASVIADMLAYEADEFDGPADLDLNVSGADLVDAFTGWRTRLREALAGGSVPILNRILEAGDELAGLLDDAVSTHIYDEQNGDEQPDDCPYKLAGEGWAAAKAAVAAPQLVIVIDSGMVSEVYGYGLPADVPIIFADKDNDDEHTVVLDVGESDAVEIAMCSVDNGTLQTLTAPPQVIYSDDEIAAEHVPGKADHFRLNQAGMDAVTAARAGYTVQQQAAGWVCWNPEGEILPGQHATEGGAWRAAGAEHHRRTPAPGEFSKAIDLGYKVNRDPAGGWELLLPDDSPDEDPEMAFATEREAWQAADNHRMFGRLDGPSS